MVVSLSLVKCFNLSNWRNTSTTNGSHVVWWTGSKERIGKGHRLCASALYRIIEHAT